ncbi:hypothetical protein FAZ69_18220 [Trinickia terrae]|uniref:Uncharacterized protein n=1 Tax=Trinickia terrae TaxID=2571161 RepID=A0A4U1I242_9BURK|nr:hypothetical protein [Trinickia terrae]TKC87269.1 hypothetical protein FAZ69_18220 [Trinickia terrae]
MRGNAATADDCGDGVPLPIRQASKGRGDACLRYAAGLVCRVIAAAGMPPAWLAALLILIALPGAPAFGAEIASLQVEPGVPVEQHYGAMTLRFLVQKQVAAVNVSVFLDGHVVGEQVMTPYDNVYPLDMHIDRAGVQGSLLARFGMAGEVSSLEGSFSVSQCREAPGACVLESVPYRLEIANWTWPSPVALKHWTVWITPELNAEVTLQFTADQNVEMDFLTAGLLIRTTSLSQGANLTRFAQGASVATVRIAPNMVLSLRPATPVQTGEIVLKGRFSSSNHHDVRYDGTLVAWRYLPSRTRGASP